LRYRWFEPPPQILKFVKSEIKPGSVSCATVNGFFFEGGLCGYFVQLSGGF